MARVTVLGMTLDTDRKVLTGAVLEFLYYQTHDIVKALNESGTSPQELKMRRKKG